MQREKGRVLTWNDEKGYGFIRPAQGGTDVFLHAKDLQLSQRFPRVNDRVAYLLVTSDTDKPSAKDVHIFGFAWSFFTLLLAGVLPLLVLYAFAVWRHQVPLYPLALAYVSMSLVTVVLYHHDKLAAKMGTWRVSERNLHALELLCGWPGALLAQLIFRHKLRKISYQIIFWLIVTSHAVAWYALAPGSPVRKRCATLIPDKIDLPTLFVKPAPHSSSPPPAPGTPAPAPRAAPAAPAPRPAEGTWTNGAPAEPLRNAPGVPRSLAAAPAQFRRLSAEIKAVSPTQGLLVALPPEIGADGTVAPSTLVADFHRRFRVGEQVTVAVRRISMKGSSKQVDVLLVEP